MKWKKFTLTTTTEAVDLISYTLDELGIEGIEIEDNIPLTEKETKGMFIDILPELPPDEGVAKVSFYLDEDDDIPAMMAKVKEALEELNRALQSPPEEPNKSGTRIGLRNVAARLHLLYNAASSLVLYKNEAGGITVEMKIQYVEQEEWT